ncbi:Cyanate hydratase [Savitreella phatthalungensis]
MIADKQVLSKIPDACTLLFEAKQAKKLSFEQIAAELDRSEVWVAALFYGQAKPEGRDIERLHATLGVPKDALEASLGDGFFPDKCGLTDMPPRDPVLYRLYEIVANFGYAYKAIIHEKFGDGIMSAIAFDVQIEKEQVDGADWVKIIQRGKFLPYKRF